jgi:hypothetical protein
MVGVATPSTMHLPINILQHMATNSLTAHRMAIMDTITNPHLRVGSPHHLAWAALLEDLLRHLPATDRTVEARLKPLRRTLPLPDTVMIDMARLDMEVTDVEVGIRIEAAIHIVDRAVIPIEDNIVGNVKMSSSVMGLY